MIWYSGFLSLAVGFLFGVGFGNVGIPKDHILFFVAFFLLILICCSIVFKKYGFQLLLSFLGVFLGFWYAMFFQFQQNQKIELLSPLYEKQISGKAKIEEILKKDDFTTTYKLDILEIEKQKVSGISFMAQISNGVLFDYKEEILFSGKLDNIDNSLENFDLQKYYGLKNIFGKLLYIDFERTNISEQNTLFGKISLLRISLLEKIQELFPQNEALLAGGILIGARESIPEDMQSAYNNSGLTHLMAVSGFNIAILIFFLLFLTQFFPVFFRIIFVSIGVLGFSFLVGDAAPVVRATIMGLASYYILMMGRKTDSLALLIFTATVMVLFQPMILSYDISFHLSFLAVIGLLYFQDFWKKICFFLPKFFAIQESFVLTLAAMTPTLPIMIFTFGQVSILAPITNMLVGGLMPFVMFFSAGAVGVSYFSETLAYYIGYVAYFFLWFVNWVAFFFGNMSWSVYAIDVSEYSQYLKILYFLFLTFLFLFLTKNKTPE